MPICVHCNGLVPYVYTVYTSKSNIRLAVCNQCNLFADPLIEYPLVLLLIDLILLKPRVYRHLVFNRGSEPYQAGRKPPIQSGQAEKPDGGEVGSEQAVDEERRVTEVDYDRRDITWRSILLLAVTTMSVEIPTFAQHLTSTAISAAFLKISNPRWLDPSIRKLEALTARRSAQEKRDCPTLATNADSQPVDRAQSPSTDRDTEKDGRGVFFTLPMISLTLFFSSLLPCLLHACLFIWSNIPDEETGAANHINPQEQHIPQSKLATILINHLTHVVTLVSPTLVYETHLAWQSIASLMKREGINEMWIVVRLLAGMSSGFGLRVILPGPPWQASVAVLGGWLVKTAIQTGLHAYSLA